MTSHYKCCGEETVVSHSSLLVTCFSPDNAPDAAEQTRPAAATQC